MDSGRVRATAERLGQALLRFIIAAIALPLLLVPILGIPVQNVLAVMSGGLLIEYGAAPLGLALGLSPWAVAYILVCTETGLFLGLYDIFRTVGESSTPVARFLEKSRKYSHSSLTVERYGILALVPCEILLGVYVCAPVSWILGWSEYRSLLVTMAAYLLCLAATIWLSLGLLKGFLP